MLGLIIKDLINLKKQARISILVLVIYAIFAIQSKNISMFNVMILIFLVMMPVTALAYDERANWDKYGLTMPVSRVDMVESKYILGLILLFVGVVIAFIFNIALGTQITGEFLIGFADLACIGVIYLALIYPIMLKLGVEKGRMAMLALVAAPTLLVVLIPNVDEIIEMFSTISMYRIILPIVAIVLYVSSCLLSIQIYRKKEF